MSETLPQKLEEGQQDQAIPHLMFHNYRKDPNRVQVQNLRALKTKPRRGRVSEFTRRRRLLAGGRGRGGSSSGWVATSSSSRNRKSALLSRRAELLRKYA